VGGREQQRRPLPVCARVKHGNIPIYRYSCYAVHEAPKKFRRHSKFTSSQTCVTDDEVSSSVPRSPSTSPFPLCVPRDTNVAAAAAAASAVHAAARAPLYTTAHYHTPPYTTAQHTTVHQVHHHTPPSSTTVQHRTPPHTAHHLAPDFTQCSFGVKMKVVLK